MDNKFFTFIRPYLGYIDSGKMFRQPIGYVYMAKHVSDVRSHKAMIHDIGVTYHYCDEIGCKYKAKQAGNVRRHKVGIPNIDVTYYLCDQKGCDDEAKQADNVKSSTKQLFMIASIYKQKLIDWIVNTIHSL